MFGGPWPQRFEFYSAILLILPSQAGYPAELCDLALRLAHCQATTAPLETWFSGAAIHFLQISSAILFSAMALTYGKLRTRLHHDRAMKLTCLWRAPREHGGDTSDEDWE